MKKMLAALSLAFMLPTLAHAENFSGTYSRLKLAGTMTVSKNGDLYHVSLDGASPDNGAATAADCSVEEDGSIRNNVFVSKDESTKINFSKRIAKVITFDGSACGVQANLGGVYKKK